MTFDNATLRQVSTEQRKNINRLKTSLDKESLRKSNNSKTIPVMMENQMLKNKIEAYKQVMNNHGYERTDEFDSRKDCSPNQTNKQSNNLNKFKTSPNLNSNQINNTNVAYNNDVWSYRTQD